MHRGGVTVASAQGCKADDDAAPTPFTADLRGAGGLGQIAHCSAPLSGRGLLDEWDTERFGQQRMPLSFTNFFLVPQHPEELMYISDFDDTDSEAKWYYDIGADLGGASPAHVWMRELQLNSKGAQSEDYEDIQDHEGQDKQNKQKRGDFIQEELYPPSLLGPSQPYRILRDRAPPKLPLPKWASSTKPTKTIRTKNVGKRRAKWTDDDLVGAIACYDVGYKLGECCKAFNIPKSSLEWKDQV